MHPLVPPSTALPSISASPATVGGVSFRRIGHRIALRFTAFVFCLLVLNGLLSLTVEFGNARRQTRMRLDRLAAFARQQLQEERSASGAFLPPLEPAPPDLWPRGPVGRSRSSALSPMARERVRILDASGAVLWRGSFFADVPFSRSDPYSAVTIQGEQYIVMTVPIVADTRLGGYMQVAELERLPFRDLLGRSLVYLIISVAISGLTYVVGLLFARRSLAPAEEMTARLEQFTQDASHELKTPIAAVQSSLELALKTGKHREGIESAQQELRHITYLVERLLELARLDRLTLAPATVDLSSLVRSAVDQQRRFTRDASVGLSASIESGVTVRGDSALLQQVILNLLANAVKFRKADSAAVAVTLTRRVLTVRDNGIGIGVSDLPRVFDRFFQADASRARGGYGLGLALVKRIVELHGWSIGVESEAGEGTTVTIRLTP